MSTPHQYSIVASDPGAHLFSVTVTVAEPDPAGQAFAIPAWIPGSYLIRDLARQVVAIRAEADGREIGLSKIDKSTWQADPCESPLTLSAQIYAHDLSVRGAHVDTTHAFFDGACVFPAVIGQEDRACQLAILPPQKSIGSDWRVATSMQPLNAQRYEFGTYITADYADFIYKCTDIYHPASEQTLAWNDPTVGIEWPVPAGETPQLAAKDAEGHSWADCPRFD